MCIRDSYMIGGGQERGMRSGTENVPGIAGMAEASRLACGELEENLAHVTSLRDRLLEGILREIPEVRVNSPAGAAPCLPYILNVSFLGTRAEVLLLSLIHIAGRRRLSFVHVRVRQIGSIRGDLRHRIRPFSSDEG